MSTLGSRGQTKIRSASRNGRGQVAALLILVVAALALSSPQPSLAQAEKVTPGKLDPVAAAARGQLRLNPMSRASVVKAFAEVYLPAASTATGWRGDVDRCEAASIAPRSRIAQLALVNYFRSHAGDLEPVSHSAAMGRRAQEAALMMRAGDHLSHTPGPEWPCHSEAGALGAAGANLAATDGVDAIFHYMWDHGSSNADVGHRRWLLHPATRKIGLGSTDETQAMYVTDLSRYWRRPATTPAYVTWPPAGFVPRELTFPRWSFSATDPDASIDSAKVSVSVQRSGSDAVVDVPVQVVYRYRGATLGPTVVFEPNFSAALGEDLLLPADPYRATPPEPDLTVTVRVSGVLVDGSLRQHSYRVKVIDTRCLGAQPTVVGTPGVNRLVGTAGDDVMVGFGGNDVIRGGAGDDRICAGPGNDRVQGGPGNDQIVGGAGRDRLVGGPGNDLIAGNSGRDHLLGQSGIDWLVGGHQSDRLWGGAGVDVLKGGTGKDALIADPPKR